MNFNRITSLALFAALAAAGAAATEYVVDGIRYDCSGSGNSAKAIVLPAKATDTPYAGDIVIPSAVHISDTGRDYNVVELKKEAFAASAVTSVELPAGITSLGMSCFEDCTELTSVVLPTSTSMMPQYCFKGCTSLESIEIPSTFGTMQGNVFEGCTALKEVTLPAGSGYLLGANFFKDCASLEHVVVPGNFTLLGVNLFQGCTSLQWVEFQYATPGKSYLSAGMFDDDFLANGTIYVPDGSEEAYKAINGMADVNILPVSARVETPEPEWVSRGEATFFDPWICSVFREPRYSWKVEVEESTSRPGYFRMKNPYLNGKCPMFVLGEANDVYINAEDPTAVYIESQGLGFTPNSSVAPEFLISSVAGRHIENNIGTLEDDKAAGLTGFYNEGIIRIPQGGMLWSFPPYTDDDYYWCKYDFELRFPDAVVYEIDAEVMCIDDYYLNLWKECVTPGETVPVMVEASNGIASIKYGVIPGVENPTSSELVTIANSDNTIEAGRNDFAVPDNYVGRMSLIIAAIDSKGNVRDYARVLFDVINEDVYGPWKSIGWTKYEDVIMYSIYEAFVEPYAVEVEESTSTPGIYRLKNVYSPNGYWNSSEGNLHHHEDQNHYLYINAEDPAWVYVMPSPVGMKGNDGSMLLTSLVAINLANGYPMDIIQASAPDFFGSRSDSGLITIPDGMVYASETRYENGEYYSANLGMEMRIQLPGFVGVEEVEAEADGKDARYFNLQGVEVKNPAPGTPVIRVVGDKATKVIM